MTGISKEQKKILNTLLDKYERSATFRGDNTVKQSFSVKPEEVFSTYSDDADYDCFVSVNEAVEALCNIGYVNCVIRNSVVRKISLNMDKIPGVYQFLARVPKSATIEQLKAFLEEKQRMIMESNSSDSTDGKGADFPADSDCDEVKNALKEYLSAQDIRLGTGKLPEYYDDMQTYSDLWKLLDFLSEDHCEIFVRDLSVKLYRDSKLLEKISGKAEALLYKYGNFPEKEKILEECSVMHTPTYVMCKGCMKIHFDNQELDLGTLTGDIAFSNKTLREVSEIEVYGERLITIENLTTFHRYDVGNTQAAVYLGGFHNSIKRDFIKRIYLNNPGLDFFHFGDIDVGGFYIYEHLCKKTGIPFVPMNMGIPELEKYHMYAKKLTSNDVSRIEKLILKYVSNEYDNSTDSMNRVRDEIVKTLRFMLENNVKLEQEAIENSLTDTTSGSV